MTISEKKILSLLLGLLAVLGCAAGEKLYTSTAENNLRIESKLPDNGFFERNAAFLYIYEVTAKCELNYIGYVGLERSLIDIGLPTGKLLQLTVEFVQGHISGSGRIRTNYSYLLQPRPGYEYTADVRNTEKLYKFSLKEGRRGGGAKRAVEPKNLASCIAK